MSVLLTPEILGLAVSFARPSIEWLMKKQAIKRKDLCIVIVDPTVRMGDPSIRNLKQFCKKAILHEAVFGKQSKWEYPFDDIARRKAFQTWRNGGMCTHYMQTRAPFLLTPKDTVYYGSYFADGLLVASSGVQPWYDLMISKWVHAAIQALCVNQVETKQLRLSKSGHFVAK